MPKSPSPFLVVDLDSADSIPDKANEFTKLCKENDLTDDTVQQLVSEGFNSIKLLSMAEKEDISEMNLKPKAQFRAVLSLVNMAKQYSKSNTMENIPAGVETNQPSENCTSSAPTTGGPFAGEAMLDALLKSLPDNTSNQQCQPTAAGLHTSSTTQTRLDLDPTIYLTPRTSSMMQGKHFEIVEFISHAIFDEAEHVVSEIEGGSKLVIKAAPKRVKLESINVWQWAVAAIRIQDQLTKLGLLNEYNVRNYMAYMIKILELNSRFDWISVLMYDREYRLYQSQYGFAWGTDIPHLTTCFLKEKDIKFQGGGQFNKEKSKRFVGKPQNNKKSENQNCREFNYKGSCNYNPCKYVHTCDVPGCGQAHPAINHVTVNSNPIKNS